MFFPLDSGHARRSSAVTANLMLAPMVAAMRLPLLAQELGHTFTDRSETFRAANEKVEAAAEGMLAGQMALYAAALRFWPEVVSGRTPSLFNGAAVHRTFHAAFRPTGRRVKANYRRLSAGRFRLRDR